MSTFQFILDLKEKVSKPLKKVSSNFEVVKKKAKKVMEVFDDMDSPLKKVSSTTDVLKSKFGKMNKTLGGLPALMAGAFAVSKVTSFGGEVVNTLAEFERFEAVLTNTLGSNSAAQKALSQITAFATETPFQINELSDSFVRLANQNFTPTMSEMTQLGDLASSVGASFDEVTNAVIAGRVMEFESLKKFGVTAKKEGDKIKFLYKEQETVVNANSTAVTDYVLSLGKLNGVQGASAAIAKTTGGQLSNLEGNFMALKLQIGQELKPVIEAVIAAMSRMVDRLRALVSWIKENQDEFIYWMGIMGKITGIILSVTAAMKIFNFVVSMNPIGLMIAAVALLMLGLWELYNMFPQIGEVISVFYDGVVYWFSLAKYFVYDMFIKPIIEDVYTIGEAIGTFYDGVVYWFGLAKDWVYDTFINPIFESLNSIGEFFGILSEKKIDPIKSDSIDVLRETTEQLKALDLGIGDNVKGFIPKGGATTREPGLKENKRNPTSSSSKSQKVKGLSDVVASKGSVNNTVIKIGKLVENMNFNYAGSTKERPSDVKEEMRKALVQAVNNVNHAT